MQCLDGRLGWQWQFTLCGAGPGKIGAAVQRGKMVHHIPRGDKNGACAMHVAGCLKIGHCLQWKTIETVTKNVLLGGHADAVMAKENRTHGRGVQAENRGHMENWQVKAVVAELVRMCMSGKTTAQVKNICRAMWQAAVRCCLRKQHALQETAPSWLRVHAGGVQRHAQARQACTHACL